MLPKCFPNGPKNNKISLEIEIRFQFQNLFPILQGQSSEDLRPKRWCGGVPRLRVQFQKILDFLVAR